MSSVERKESPGEEATARLVEEHRILKEAVQFNPANICVYDRDDRLIAWNPAYEALHSESFAVLRPKALAGEMRYEELVRMHLKGRMPPAELEVEVARRVKYQAEANGEPIIRRYEHATLRVHKYRLPSGGSAGIAIDITDLEAARNDAENAAKAKADFLAKLSHEIRTPMNGILGLSALLAETELSEEQQELLSVIRSSGDALLSTINGVLDMSKIEAGKETVEIARFDLAALLSDIIALMRPIAATKKLSLSLNLAADIMGEFRGDALKIRQCVLNILGNALKFTETGGVSVSANAGLLDQKPAVAIAVSDTGPGLPEGDLFEAFNQGRIPCARKSEGTGLGLSITDGLMRLMGGEIAVLSSPEKGATFILNLPISQA